MYLTKRIERATVVLLALDPTIGHEQRGVRPCDVVSDPDVIADRRFPLVYTCRHVTRESIPHRSHWRTDCHGERARFDRRREAHPRDHGRGSGRLREGWLGEAG